MSNEQSGFGFAVELLERKTAGKLVVLRRGGLFWMFDAGFGALPLCPATVSLEDATASAKERFPWSVVEVRS